MTKWLTTGVIVMFVLLVWLINSLVFSHPLSYRINDFPHLSQPDGITCGPTSAAMVLRYYEKDVTVDEVKMKTKTQWFKYHDQSIGMTSPEYLPIAMKHFGVPASLKRGYLPRLKYHVGQGKPCVVLLRSGEHLWHYVVVIGYDSKFVFVADPGSGVMEQLNNEAFQGAWNFSTDMRGNAMKNKWLVDAMRVAEVYPNTMVIPRIHIGSFP